MRRRSRRFSKDFPEKLDIVLFPKQNPKKKESLKIPLHINYLDNTPSIDEINESSIVINRNSFRDDSENQISLTSDLSPTSYLRNYSPSTPKKQIIEGRFDRKMTTFTTKRFEEKKKTLNFNCNPRRLVSRQMTPIIKDFMNNFGGKNSSDDENKYSELKELEFDEIFNEYHRRSKVNESNSVPHLIISLRNDYEKMEYMIKNQDKILSDFPTLQSTIIYFQIIAMKIKGVLESKAYSLFFVLVISFHTLVYMREIYDQSIRNNSFYTNIYTGFLMFYFLDILIKAIISILLMRYKVFFKNRWDIIDLIFVLLNTFNIFKSTIPDIFLKMIRILSIFRILVILKNLEIIVKAIIMSSSKIASAILILIVYVDLQALFNLHSFLSFSRKVCFWEESGIIFQPIIFCNNSPCNKFQFCADSIFQIEIHDHTMDFQHSLFQSLKILTLDSWSNPIHKYIDAFSEFIAIYYFFSIIIGTFILLPVILVIIKSNFSEIHERIDLNTENLAKVNKRRNRYYKDLFFILKELRLWNRKENFLKKKKKIYLELRDDFSYPLVSYSKRKNQVKFNNSHLIPSCNRRASRVSLILPSQLQIMNYNSNIFMRVFSKTKKVIQKLFKKIKLKNIGIKKWDLKVDVDFNYSQEYSSFLDIIENQFPCNNFRETHFVKEIAKRRTVRTRNTTATTFIKPGDKEPNEYIIDLLNIQRSVLKNKDYNSVSEDSVNNINGPEITHEKNIEKDSFIDNWSYSNLLEILKSKRNIIDVKAKNEVQKHEFRNQLNYYAIMVFFLII